jgi:hypothetical protein
MVEVGLWPVSGLPVGAVDVRSGGMTGSKQVRRPKGRIFHPKRKSAYGMVESATGVSNSTAFAISSVSVQLRVSHIVSAAPDKCHIRIF